LGIIVVMAHLLELDSRRRISLGQLARHDRYLVTAEPDGTLVLTPAVVMTETEARLLQNPELVERIKANLADPSRMKRRRKVG
jgi:prophage tail gpP-like protein